MQSETYELLDTLFYDEATSNHKNEYWFCNSWDNISVSNTGTTIEEFTSTALNYALSNVANSSTWGDRKFFPIGFAVEFDILEYAPNVRLVVNNSAEDKSISTVINANSHFKFEMKDGEYTVTRDNNTPVTTPHNINENVRIILMTNNDGVLGKLAFNNFKVYSI